jgi:hypothetical protein
MEESNYTHIINLIPFAYDLNPVEHYQRNKSTVFPQNKQLIY